MKISYPLGFQLLAPLIVWSCSSSLKMNTDYNKNVDFAKYKTFAIYNSANLVQNVSQLNHDRIVYALKNEMTKKGFAEADTNSANSADLVINTTAIFQNRASVSSYNYYGYDGMYRPYGWGNGVGYTDFDVRLIKMAH